MLHDADPAPIASDPLDVLSLINPARVSQSSSLCQLALDWDGNMREGGALLEEKLDGIRAMYFEGRDGVRRLWSRNGHFIEGTAHIAHRLAHMEKLAGRKLFFDGEFVVDDTLAATKAWFDRGHKAGGEAGVLHLFDCMPLEQWQAGGTPTSLVQRKDWLKQLLAAAQEELAGAWTWRQGSHGRDEDRSALVVVEDERVRDAADVINAAMRIWARNGEGCMIKDPMAPYRRGRSAAWGKVKRDGPWSRRLSVAA